MDIFQFAPLIIGPISIFLIVVGIGKTREEKKALPHIIISGEGYTNQNKDDDKPSNFDRWLRSPARWFAVRLKYLQAYIMPGTMSEKLDYAGRPYDLTVDEAYGLQWVGIVVGVAIGLYLGLILIGIFGGLFAGALFGIGGIFVAPMWLDSVADDRQTEISLALPDTLGILVIAMDAGMGFDKALERVIPRMQDPLKEEFGRLQYELSLGTPREEAFTNLFNRNNSPELRAVVGAVIQGYQLGSPISEVFSDQASEMRSRRIRLAKELGAKASPKIALVTGMIMAPAIACLILVILANSLINEVGPILLGPLGNSPIP